jgi:hypothetical protein
VTTRAIRGVLLAAGLFALPALALVACGGGASGDHTAVGVIVDLKSTSLTSIDNFTLQMKGGRRLVFEVAPSATQDLQEGFIPGHLRSHMLGAEQVRIHYLKTGDRLFALRMEHLGVDATPSPTS